MDLKVFENIGLSPKEAKIIMALTELGSAKISELSKKVTLPRTSLYPLLQKLSKRGFVHEVRVQNHKEWQAVEPKDIKKIAQEALKNIEAVIPELEGLREFLPVSKSQSEILYYKSDVGAKKVFELLLKLKPGERVYGIEGAKAFDETMLRSLSLINFSQKWQENFKKSKVILEGIISEKALEMFKKLDKEMISLYADRLVVATVLPNEMLDFNVNVYTFRDTLIIVSFIQNLAIVINNPEVAKVFKILFRIAQASGRKVDLNAYIRDLLRK